jgi:hypothetical protein
MTICDTCDSVAARPLELDLPEVVQDDHAPVGLAAWISEPGGWTLPATEPVTPAAESDWADFWRSPNSYPAYWAGLQLEVEEAFLSAHPIFEQLARKDDFDGLALVVQRPEEPLIRSAATLFNAPFYTQEVLQRIPERRSVKITAEEKYVNQRNFASYLHDRVLAEARNLGAAVGLKVSARAAEVRSTWNQEARIIHHLGALPHIVNDDGLAFIAPDPLRDEAVVILRAWWNVE